MVNLKSLLAIVMTGCLLLVLVGLVRFGVDFWSYHHAPTTANAHLDFRGVTMMAMSLIMAAIVFGLFLMRKH